MQVAVPGKAAVVRQFIPPIRPVVHFMVIIALEIAISIPGMLVVDGFSRLREYRADTVGAELGGRGYLVAALRSLAGNDQL